MPLKRFAGIFGVLITSLKRGANESQSPHLKIPFSLFKTFLMVPGFFSGDFLG
jgi:hypothetical protein